MQIYAKFLALQSTQIPTDSCEGLDNVIWMDRLTSIDPVPDYGDDPPIYNILGFMFVL